MAVTKSGAVQALTAAALALPGMLIEAEPLQSKPTLDLQYGRYQESDDRISVDIYQGTAVLPVSDLLILKTDWVVDTFSGATPVLTMPNAVAQTTTGASGISGVNKQLVATDEQAIQVMTGASTRETRYGVDIGLSYQVNKLRLHASGSRSEEPDYLSQAYHLGLDWDFNQKLTTLSLDFGQNFDRVEPTTRKLQEEKSDHHLNLGLSQVLSKQSLLRLSGNFTHSDGYLSNPYKKVFIQYGESLDLENGGFDRIFYENRPGKRDQWSLSVGYIQYIEATDASLHLDYRFFTDSWDIVSHTFEAAYYQPLDAGWMLEPRLRYYSQTGARFYQLYYAAPRLDGHYSSDFRLADFGALSAGLKLSREWRSPAKVFENIKLAAGFEYTAHAAALHLGGQSASDITDFNYVLFTGSVKITF